MPSLIQAVKNELPPEAESPAEQQTEKIGPCDPLPLF